MLDSSLMRQPVEGVMAKKTSKTESAALPSHDILPVRAYLDVNEVDLETQKMNEIAQLVRLPDGRSKAAQNARLARALDLYEGLAPTDGLEGMLAAQMVGTHHAALECLRMAAVPGQTFVGRDMNLKHAQKLMALYTAGSCIKQTSRQGAAEGHRLACQCSCRRPSCGRQSGDGKAQWTSLK